MEKFEVQLDNDLEQSKAPQVMIIFFFSKIGRRSHFASFDLINPTWVFVWGILVTAAFKPMLSQF